MMAKRLGVAVLGVVENMSRGTPTGAKQVADALGCDVLGTISLDEKLGELSDANKIPVNEDGKIREEFISILKRITG